MQILDRLIEFTDSASVDSEPALDDASIDVIAFEGDFVEIHGKVSFSFRPNIGDVAVFG